MQFLFLKLIGADTFRSEWPFLLKELVDTDNISEDCLEKHKHLSIVGMVGSVSLLEVLLFKIDNDMVGTEMTVLIFKCSNS